MDFFHGRFAADEGDDGLAVFGRRLGREDDNVSLDDVGPDHAAPLDPQGPAAVVGDEAAVEGQGFFGILDGLGQGAGLDVTDDGDVDDVGKEGQVHELDVPRPVETPFDVALSLQRHEVVPDGGDGPEAEGLGDFGGARLDSVLPGERDEVVVDLLLPLCQLRDHGSCRG